MTTNLFKGFALLCLCGTASAQTDTLHKLSDTTQLKTVDVIQGDNNNHRLLDLPQSLTPIDAREIKRGNGLFFDDAINTNVPGVFMQRRAVSSGQQFNIRGYGNGVRGTNGVNSNFDTQGSKVYLNGIPVTDAEGITVLDDIDFGSVDNADVLKGPSGTLYGLAIAGVINLYTVKATPGVTIGQDALFGSYGLQRLTTHIGIGRSNSSILINYGNQKYAGFMQHTASHKDFVNFSGTVQISGKRSFSAYLGYSNSYDQRNGELTEHQYDTLDYTGNPAYINNNAHSEVISLRVGLSHKYQFADWISNTTALFGSAANTNASSAGGWTDKVPLNYGLRSTFDTKFKLSDKVGLSGTTGIEAQQQYAQTIGYAMVKDSSNLNGYNIIGAMRSNVSATTGTASLFTEWTLRLPYAFAVTAGLGYSMMEIELMDRFYVSTNNNPSNPAGTHKPTRYRRTYGDMMSPRIAVNKTFSDKFSVYASYSTGYKAPVSSYFYIPLTGEIVEDLKPERGTQIEVGTKGSLLHDRLFYHFCAFQTIFADKMTVVAVPNAANTATSYTYVTNGGSQDHKGVEALIKYNVIAKTDGFFPSVTPFVNAAFSDFRYVDYKFQKLSANKKDIVEVDYSGNSVAGVPPVAVNAGIDVTTKSGLYANLTYNYRDGVYITSDEVYKTASYNLLNAKLGFSRQFGHIGLDVYAGANNLTGTQYYYMVFVNQLPDAYLPAPNEINFFGGINLNYKF